ncbi:MAG: RNA polymerase sigma factor [Deltaproteobacteria bacterium]|nr:RNA polymerase sigma factor [Deltaproteobacteria bacterium]
MSARVPTERLFREHAPFVASFLRRLGVHSVDVDDAVQEVFLVAHQRGFTPGPATPRSWLGAIAWRVASARRRAATHRREIPDDSGIHDLRATTAGPAAAAETREALVLAGRALDSLDEEHRVPFILFELEGESCASIAAGLEVPLGTVYSRLHNARRRFLAAYAEAARDPSDATDDEVGR